MASNVSKGVTSNGIDEERDDSPNFDPNEYRQFHQVLRRGEYLIANF